MCDFHEQTFSWYMYFCMCAWSIAVCCGDIFCTGIHNLLTVTEDIDGLQNICLAAIWSSGSAMLWFFIFSCHCLLGKRLLAVVPIQRSAKMAHISTQWLEIKYKKIMMVTVYFSLFSHPFSHQKCDIGYVKFSVQYKLQNNS